MQDITRNRLGKVNMGFSGEHGQTVVEAALVLVFLIPVIFISLHTFIWMQARQTIIHTAVEAAKTVNITGCPEKTQRVIDQNMGNMLGKQMFDASGNPVDVDVDGVPHKSVEIYFTDNFNTTASATPWPHSINCTWPDWHRKDVDLLNSDYRNKSGLKIILHYRLPDIFQDDPLLPSYVKAESWAPFNYTP